VWVVSALLASSACRVKGVRPVSAHSSRRGGACLSTTSPPNTEQQRADKMERLAARLLRRARLRRRQGVSRRQVAAALAKALATAGPASPHGQLLIAALTPTAAARPAAQWAVRLLLGDGQVPTPAAVVADRTPGLNNTGQALRFAPRRVRYRGVR